MKSPMSRRHLLGLVAAGSGMMLAGCNSSSRPAAAEEKNGNARTPVADAAKNRQMLVYRDPECGCCEAWAQIAREAGYEVTVESRADMPAIKRMSDEAWWRRKIRRTQALLVEEIAIELGFVHRQRQCYCSDETVKRRRAQTRRNALTLEGIELEGASSPLVQ